MKIRTDVPLSYERANELFVYDPESGELRWKIKRGKMFPGTRAGCARSDGVRHVRVDGIMYLEHHIIWLLVNGVWPSDQIDHKDLNPSNNTLQNLRVCTNGQNNANKKVRPDSVSGIKGVRFDERRGHWVAHITKDWKIRYLGSFATSEAAAEAYKKAAEDLHGEFARAG